MKGQRQAKFYIQHCNSSDYLSNELQITCKDYWSEFDNCKKYMENHNKQVKEEYDEYEQEYMMYNYRETLFEGDNYTKTERIFDFQCHTVYLIEIRCKEGFHFKTKKEMN